MNKVKIVLFSLLFMAIMPLIAMEDPRDGFYDEDIYQQEQALAGFERKKAEQTFDAFLTQETANQSLGDMVQNNGIQLLCNGEYYKPTHPLYNRYLHPLKQIKTFFGNSGAAIDISDLKSEGRLNALQEIQEFPPCVICHNWQKRPWYKKYTPHILGGAALLATGSLLMFAFQKYFGR
jgi:hypothetical protein